MTPAPNQAFDADRLLARAFPDETRRYGAHDAAAWARDFGAGLAGALQLAGARFLAPAQALALPMIAVPLCDGEFWQQRPETGIDWRRIVHAEETLIQHVPLPGAGELRVARRVADLQDQGVDRGARMVERQALSDAATGRLMVEVEVTTLLRGNGGFGGTSREAPRPPPLPERPADAFLDVRSPTAQRTRLCLPEALALSTPGIGEGQRMMRGVGCFGLAGRGVLALACANTPERLRRLSVRYARPLLTDETLRLELWILVAGEGLFRLSALDREGVVVARGSVAWQ